MKRKLRKIFGVILVLALVFPSVPLSGFTGLHIGPGIWAKALEQGNVVYLNDEAVDYAAGLRQTELRLPALQAEEPPSPYGESVETSEYSKTYQTGKRTFRTVYSEIPNLFYNEKGQAQDYDNTLGLESKFLGADYYTNQSSNIDVQLSTRMLDKGVSFTYDGVTATLVPQEGDYSRSAAMDNAIRYNDVFDGVDVQYTVRELGLKEDIILSKYVERNTFSYELNVKGGTAVLKDGVLLLSKKGSDEVAFTVSAPLMVDADGKMSEDVQMTLEGDVLTVTADPEWLAAPERAYPVSIDPSFNVPSGKIENYTYLEGTNGYYGQRAYAYVGYIVSGSLIGYPVDVNWFRTRTLFQVNDDFSAIPEGSRILNATFQVYQYTAGTNGLVIQCNRMKDAWSPATTNFTQMLSLDHENAASSTSGAEKFHRFNITDTFDRWYTGIDPNYGLMLLMADETRWGGSFYTSSSTSGQGTGTFTPDKAPQIIVEWEVPNPVPLDTPIDTTLDLRTIMETHVSGKMNFRGIFADGLVRPYAAVTYNLSDSAKGQDGVVPASPSYKYPDSLAWTPIYDAAPKATKYKFLYSNWQTQIPFTNPDFSRTYWWTAQAALGGTTGAAKESDHFLVHKVTQFDTLQKIGNFYGVPLQQILFDNRAPNMLVVENNTIVIINPTRNQNKAYNPAPLTDAEKRMIDSLLMGRGLHCEFGFEPINLNTGNFYMSQTDISIPDFNGDFAIERSYNSKQAGIFSHFGRGWQYDYADQLSKLEDGTIVLWRGDGSSVYFKPNGSGGYTCSNGYYLELTPIKVGTALGEFNQRPYDPDDEHSLEFIQEPYDIFEYEIQDADKSVKRFSTQGFLKSITDAKGFVTTLSYDANGNPSGITSPAGVTYGITCAPDGKITEITVPGGVIRYEYDNDDNLIGYINELGCKTIYRYDSAHQMTSWEDAEGNVIIINTYDAEGRVTKQVDSEGNVTTLAYADGQTTTTDANGDVTVYHYDSQYRTTKIDYSDGTTEVKAYDSGNNLASVTDRAGIQTTFNYNADGAMTRQNRYDSKARAYTYNALNKPTGFTDFDGGQSAYRYDAKGNLLELTNPDGSTQSFIYDAQSRVVESTDARGNKTAYEYAGTWLSKATDTQGNETKYYYNGRGSLITLIDAKGETTRFFYDAAGQQTGYQQADGATVSMTYDQAGCLKTLTNANGYVYTYENDGIGNLTKLTDPLGNAVAYTYDGIYNEQTVAYPSSGTVKKEYDAFSQLVAITDEENHKTSYDYDRAGNIKKITDPKGNVTEYTYDLRFNKPLTAKDALGNVTTLDYDDVGNLLRVTAANGAVTGYTYDAMNRVKTVAYPAGLAVTLTYDANGNVLKQEDSMGRATAYEYDSLNRLVKQTAPNGAVTQYVYDGLGQLLSVTDAKGGVARYTYNVMGRVATFEDAAGRKSVYVYDPNGNLLKETAPNNGVTLFVYDALDRISKVTDPLGHSTVMEYDSMDNLLAVTNALNFKEQYSYSLTGLATQYTDPLGNASAFDYDPNGNLVKVTDAKNYIAAIAYDPLNRAVKTTDPLGLVTDFGYDAIGNLLSEQNNNGGDNRHTYDSAGRLLTSTDALGQVTRYTYDAAGNILTVTTPDGNTTSYTYGKIDEVLSMTDPENKTTAYTYDLLGNLLSSKDAQARVWAYQYDIVSRLTKATNPLNEATQYQFNEFDFITKKTLPNGAKEEAEYDLVGNLLRRSDANGNATRYTYDALYRQIAQKAPDGGEQGFSYDAAGNLTQHIDALGNKSQYAYDPLGNISKVTSAKNAVYNYTHDAAGNVLQATNPLGGITAFTYDIQSRLLSKTLANTAQYSYQYDAIGRVTQQAAPEGLLKQYAYDAKGNLASETDQSGRVISYAYDLMHRLTDVTNPKGDKTSFAYDVAGNLCSVLSPKGYQTSFQYDLLDRLAKSLDPVGRTEEYSYDVMGNVTRLTQNGKRGNSFSYDNVGNLTGATNAKNQTRSFVYDSMNRMTKETDYANNSFRYGYDYNGNLTGITDKNGFSTQFTYDAHGNLSSRSDGADRVVAYRYDLLDRLTSVQEGGKVTANYGYDVVGNLTAYTDGKGKTTQYAYNLLGQMTSIQDPLGKVKTFGYNVNAMLETVTNQDGSTVNYDYDQLDQLLTKKYDEEQAIGLYGFDSEGNRIQMTDVAGTSNYEYDAAGRVTAVVLQNGTSQITYTYDEFGNLAKLGYPDGTGVTYTYDELDQMTSITDRQGKVTTYEYDRMGNLVKVKRPNNTSSELNYDAMGNVTQVKNFRPIKFFGFIRVSTKVATYSYTYDGSGFIASEKIDDYSDHPARGFFTWILQLFYKKNIDTKYTYDERGQLTESKQTDHKWFWSNTVTASYTYDGAGNRLTKNVAGKKIDDSQETYTYDDADQLTQVSRTAKNCTQRVRFQYDANGNLVNTKELDGLCKDERKFTYDNENRLTAVKENGTLLMAALYDGDGERIFTVNRKGGDYVSNGGGSINCPTNEKGRAVEFDAKLIVDEMLVPNGVKPVNYVSYELTGYINDANRRYSQVLMEYGANQRIVNYFDYGAAGRNSVSGMQGKFFYDYDGRGSVTGLTRNDNSYTAVSYRYDDSGNATRGGNGLINNPYTYNGEYSDLAAGLQYLRARYYAPENGSFTSRDTYLGSAGVPLSKNAYTYAHNNPVNYKDPSGYWANWAIGALVGGVVGGIVGGVKAAVSGESIWKGAVSGAAGGALSGVLLGSGVPPVAAFAAGNLLTNTLDYSLNKKSGPQITGNKTANIIIGIGGQTIIDTAFDWLFFPKGGGLTPRISGFNAGRGNAAAVFQMLRTKLCSNIVSRISGQVIVKGVATELFEEFVKESAKTITEFVVEKGVKEVRDHILPLDSIDDRTNSSEQIKSEELPAMLFPDEYPPGLNPPVYG